MAEILSRQTDLLKRISRCVKNLKKTGAARINKSTVTARLEMLDGLWKDYNENHYELVGLAQETPAVRYSDYMKKEHIEIGEESYLDQRGKLMDMLAEFESIPQGTESRDLPETSLSQRDVRPRAVLPRIELPKFDGRIQDWPTFRDLFTSLVINDESLSNVERFHYLRGSLSGNAQLRLRNLPLTEQNFQRAWELLKDRYENLRLIINAQLSVLYSIPPVTSESAKEIRRMIDTACDVVESFEAMGRSLTKPGDLLVYHLVEKLDLRTRREWESSLGSSSDPPAFDTLRRFLDARINALASVSENPVVHRRAGEKGRSVAKVHQTSADKGKKDLCPACTKPHPLMHCPRYKAWDAARRRTFVMETSLCVNCLGRHPLEGCHSEKRCYVCKAKHHTSLHEAAPAPVTGPGSRPAVSATTALDHPATVLLATAELQVHSADGLAANCRALLDSGSQISLISEDLAQRLQLPRQKTYLPLRGVSGSRSVSTRGVVSLDLSPREKETPRVPLRAYVLPSLTRYRPYAGARELPAVFKDLDLADSDLFGHRQIDLLLGADIYPRILQDGLRTDEAQSMVAQATLFGWLLLGQTEGRGRNSCPASSLQISVDTSLQNLVERFWRLEEVNVPRTQTPEDDWCERHFVSTHSREPDGRYVVRLPLKDNHILGESRHIAEDRMRSLRRRLCRSPDMSEPYCKFMEEYYLLGHMVSCPRERPSSSFYLPHHGVHKASSTTTKLRVVFNASQATTNGKSLNDILYKGPNLLPELTDVLLRWRTYKIGLAADLVKMYRQILVHPADRDWQRILWQGPSQAEPQDLQLRTVTYGMICAPFLAIRTLRQLALDHVEEFPEASTVLLQEVYMDDILSGASSVEEARELVSSLTRLCTAGGFPIQKWRSNSGAVFSANLELEPLVELRESEEAAPVLGVQWCSVTDTFLVQISMDEDGARITKRKLLSQLARVFDPIGWLAPVTIWAKCLLQELWLSGIAWDTPLSTEQSNMWQKFHEELKLLSDLRLPRWFHTNPETTLAELHGFADASERAYAAVVYVRTVSKEGSVNVTLVGAKTKVAPLKRLSLPRLELNAALLLARYMQRVVRSLPLPADVHCWSDSRVTLHWVTSHPSRWKTYVANRVAEIQSILPDGHWHHVCGKQNPADIASRGLTPAQLPSTQLWWGGPPFLLDAVLEFPSLTVPVTTEESKTHAHTLSATRPAENETLLRFSNLETLLRVSCRCLRWKKRIEGVPRSAPITAAERRLTLLRWVRVVQEQHFPEETRAIRAQLPLAKQSRLTKLSPFLDSQDVLRVQGRLAHALLSDDQKHPFILPSSSRLTELYILAAHLKTFHGGTQLTLAVVRQEAWPLRGRQVVKAVIHRCLPCRRWTAAPLNQQMANLPSDRVRPSRPFCCVGIDYAGPVNLLTTKGRGSRRFKGYIALFVCLATRAVHLELVSGYDTETFLAAFRRLIGRRGICSRVYSDCGTNFVGAARELRQLHAAQRQADSPLLRYCVSQGIEWRFNPPSAPHFGGLWEAGVKSVKHHLRRVLGEQALTFEEFTTLLVGIEACLNSRPLQAQSDDPHDLSVLTPGHFLIGASLLAAPEPDLTDLVINRLSRWQLVRRMVQHFWKVWAKEYLTSLQPRPKWDKRMPSPCLGDLVLIRHENLPPTRWPLGRIVALHPGPDDLPRVATLRTASTELTRPVSRLVPLPHAGSNPAPPKKTDSVISQKLLYHFACVLSCFHARLSRRMKAGGMFRIILA